MLNILHIIPTLNIGGAERQLLNLVSTDKELNHCIVVLLGCEKKFLKEYDLKNINIYNLKDLGLILKLKEINKIIKNFKPTIIQTWMYHASLLSILFYFKKVPIVWSLRRTNLDLNSLKMSTFLLVRLLSFFSKFFPQGILYCADSSKKSHKTIGFYNPNEEIIYNGINVDFSLKKLKSDIPVIGFVGRNIPTKNFNKFFEFLIILENKKINVEVNVIGRGFNSEKQNSKKFRYVNLNFLGQVTNMNNQYQKMDILISTSSAEGFPNTILESMSFGVLPICTNAGDSFNILSEFGLKLHSVNSKEIYQKFIQGLKIIEESDTIKMRKYINSRFNQKLTNRLHRQFWFKISNYKN